MSQAISGQQSLTPHQAISVYELQKVRRRELNRISQRKRRERIRQQQQQQQQQQAQVEALKPGLEPEPEPSRPLKRKEPLDESDSSSSSNSSTDHDHDHNYDANEEHELLILPDDQEPSQKVAEPTPVPDYWLTLSTHRRNESVEADLFESARVRKILSPDYTLLRSLYCICDALGFSRETMDLERFTSPIPSDFERFQTSLDRTFSSDLSISSTALAFAGALSLDAQAANEYRWHIVGPSFNPTHKQNDVPHHPFVDLGFPWPEVRDNICALLRAQRSVEDQQRVQQRLCDDYTNLGTVEGNQPAIIIGGSHPLDVGSWEITQEFLNRWWILFTGPASKVVSHTNWLRRRRGLPPLRDPTLGVRKLLTKQEQMSPFDQQPRNVLATWL